MPSLDPPEQWRPTLASGSGARVPETRADARIRTADPFITSEVLYQLSYVGETSSLATMYGTGTSSEAVCRSCDSSSWPQSGGLSLGPKDWYRM